MLLVEVNTFLPVFGPTALRLAQRDQDLPLHPLKSAESHEGPKRQISAAGAPHPAGPPSRCRTVPTRQVPARQRR